METLAAKKSGQKQKMSTGLSTVRLVVTAVVILACFSALYPKFFHPIVMRMLGLSQPKQKTDSVPTHPPHRPMPSGAGADHRHDDIKKHMRPGPHPGMRAAAEMNKQNKQGSSGRGGMMGMILPVYAFGIIGYLIYTLVKVFGKKEKGEDSRYDRRGKPSEEDTNRSLQEDDDNKLKGLEELLNRASNVDPNITADEMRELQKRLEETEKQMSQILSAMQHVSTKVNTVADGVKPDEQVKTKNGNSSSDSSPDISSYEVVDKNKEKNSSEMKTEKSSESADDKKSEKMEEDQNKHKEDDDEIKDTEEILKDKQEEEESGVRQRKVHQESNEDLHE